MEEKSHSVGKSRHLRIGEWIKQFEPLRLNATIKNEPQLFPEAEVQAPPAKKTRTKRKKREVSEKEGRKTKWSLFETAEEKKHVPRKRKRKQAQATTPKAEPKRVLVKAEPQMSELHQLAEESIKENKQAISETLAKILAAQGKTKRAIEMYEALRLKFPEKNRFFAERIEALQKQ